MSILAFALFAAVHNSGGPLIPPERVLMAPWRYSAEDAAKIVANLGKVASKDYSGLYVIDLKPGVKANTAEEILRKRKDVRFVLPYSASLADIATLDQINDRLEYIEAGNALHGIKVEDGEETPGTDYLEYLRYYMEGHVNAKGVIDEQAIKTAMITRDHMPSANLAHIGKTSGNWSFVGPRNLTPNAPLFNGPAFLAGRINCVAFHPTVKTTYFAGSAAGGLWKTTDDGSTWTFLSEGWAFQTVSAIAVDPKNANIIYVGTGDYFGGAKGYHNGIMKTVDGGLHWTNIGAAAFGQFAISKIIVDAFDSNIVFVSAGHGANANFAHGGVWRSTDSGTSWTKAALADTCYSDMTVEIGNGDRNEFYYVAGDSATGGALYWSSDQGATWHVQDTPNMATQQNLRIVATTNPETEFNSLYLLEPTSRRVWGRSFVGWTDLTTGFNNGTATNANYNWSQGFYDTFFGVEKVVSGTSTFSEALWVGLITVSLGQNNGTGGRNWFDIGVSYTDDARTHNDQHAFAVCPTDPSRILFGNDGGLYKFVVDWSTGNYTITTLNGALPITQIFKLTPHPTDPNVVLTGAQDNGIPAAGGNLNSWLMLSSGDGSSPVIDLLHSRLYGTTTGGIMYRYLFNGTQDGREIHGPWPDPKSFTMPLEITKDGKFLLTATNVLQRYEIASPAWDAGTRPLAGAGSYVQVVETCVHNPAIAYTGSMDGIIFRIDLTDVDSITEPDYIQCDGNMPETQIFALSPSPRNDNDLIVGVGGSGHPHIYRCTNTLETTGAKWIPINSNLPDTPVNAIVRDPFQPDSMFYIGTDVGVFVTTNSGASWSQMTTTLGLPNVPVYDLKFGAGFLYAGTFGRGVWRIALANPTTLVSITVDPASVPGDTGSSGTVTVSPAPGGDGVFVDLSSNNTAAALVPASTKVGATGTTSTFLIDTNPVAVDKSVTISASYGGIVKKATLLVKAPLLSAVTVPAKSVGGLPFKGSVTLATLAPKTGLSVGLSSNNPAVTVPTSVAVPGAKTAEFDATTKSVATPTSVTVTATLNGITKTDIVVIMPPTVTSIVISPNPCFGGLTAKATVTIAERAPTGGLVLKLTSSTTAAANVPSTMTIAAGATTGTFNIATHGVDAQRTTVISAGDSTNSTSVTLTVKVATLSSMKMASSTVVGGLGDVCTVNLVGQAGPSGTVVGITSSNTAVAVPPASVTVPALKPSVSFTVPTKGVNAATSVTLTSKLSTIAKTVSFTVNPSPLSAITMATSSVVGGAGDVATVRLVGQAGPSGTVVSLTSSNTAVATVPASVTVPALKTSIAFTVKTLGVAATTSVTITAKLGTVTKTAVFSVTPAALLSVTTTTTSVKGGTAVSGKVTLNGFAPPANAVVSLKIDSTSATVPASVTVLKNGTTGAFTVTTKAVTTTTTVHITATYAGVTKTATLTLTL